MEQHKTYSAIFFKRREKAPLQVGSSRLAARSIRGRGTGAWCRPIDDLVVCLCRWTSKP